MNKVEISRMQRNRRELQKGNLPCERFLKHMSLERGCENLQKKIDKFKI